MGSIQMRELYRETSNKSSTLLGNEIGYHSDVPALLQLHLRARLKTLFP